MKLWTTTTLVARLFAIGLLPIVAKDARSEVVPDTVRSAGTWSFERADCGCPPCIENCPLSYGPQFFDIAMFFVTSPPLGQVLLTYFGGIALGDVPIDSVQQAPSTGYSDAIVADQNEEFQANRTYIVRTAEGGHAVIRTLYVDSLEGMEFIYKYQNDGSGTFGAFHKTSSESATWSRIKSLLH
jgi:hypothetical protein